MARKTTGNTTTRRKNAEIPVPPAAEQVTRESQMEARPDSPANGKPVQRVSGKVASNSTVKNPAGVNLEEEIRRRAYELYLQRRAAAGGENGNQHQDWLIAENEIRARYDRLARHTTA